MRALRNARLDWLIGWHQGHKERALREVERHAAAEAKWRAQYAAEFPGMFAARAVAFVVRPENPAAPRMDEIWPDDESETR